MPEADFYQKVKSQISENRAFVAYRKPGEKAVKAFLQSDDKVYKVKDLSEKGFIFAPFKTEATSYIIPSEKSEVIQFESSLEGMEKESNNDFDNFDFEQLEEDQKRHENLVQKGIDAIRAGDFKKVVLARSERVQVLDPDAVRIFRKLLHKYPQAMVYVWFHPETGYWLGATPETLMKLDRNRFETMALAGTQVYKGTDDVEWGVKEIEEQGFVTDYILDMLEGVQGVEQVKTSGAYSARAGNLLHICTDISGRLKSQENLKDLVNALHPTPAVCGLPKEKALQFIHENEIQPREFYSGYLGELNLKTEHKRSSNRRNQENQQFVSISRQTELFVNLRCMKLKDGNARIFVGGGITKDSNAADEWMETVNKSQTMKAVLVK
ncbi:chorismate-binding protein [Pontixanthobacter gangjinensis]|nr:chorismate-binding protein [Christiangramia aestuarii]